MKIEVNLRTGYFENHKDLVPLQGELKEYESKKGRLALKQSILSEGIIFPTFVWEDKNVKYIWDGHGRQDIYKELVVDGFDLPDLPVVYIIAKNKADAKIKLLKKEQDYRRKITKVGLTDFIAGELINIDDLEGLNLPGVGELDISFLDGIMEDKKISGDGNSGSDTTPKEISNKPTARRGDIYKLGNHRIMCGNSTCLDSVKKLLAGVSVDLVFTDPPYNVAFNGRSGKHDVILNDKLEVDEFENFINSFCVILKEINPAAYYVWCNWKFYGILQEKLDYKACIVWAKNVFGLGIGYRHQHEFCLFNGSIDKCVKNESDLWHVKKDTNYVHPTQKPVELFERAIKNHFSAKVVVDLFVGSGSTLIGCENTNRDFYGMELDPKYVDVAIDRWERHTGQKAVKVN